MCMGVLISPNEIRVAEGGRSRTFAAEKAPQNQGAALAERAKIEPSSWHFVGSSADLIPSLSELRCSLGVDGADGRPQRRARSGGGPS
jgi:hypothetical protein